MDGKMVVTKVEYKENAKLFHMVIIIDHLVFKIDYFYNLRDQSQFLNI